MATGQVGFHNQKLVKRVYVEKRENVIVNRLNKTKVEKFPDLKAEKEEMEREVRKKERIAAQEQVSRRYTCSYAGGRPAGWAEVWKNYLILLLLTVVCVCLLEERGCSIGRREKAAEVAEGAYV